MSAEEFHSEDQKFAELQTEVAAALQQADAARVRAEEALAIALADVQHLLAPGGKLKPATLYPVIINGVLDEAATDGDGNLPERRVVKGRTYTLVAGVYA